MKLSAALFAGILMVSSAHATNAGEDSTGFTTTILMTSTQTVTHTIPWTGSLSPSQAISSSTHYKTAVGVAPESPLMGLQPVQSYSVSSIASANSTSVATGTATLPIVTGPSGADAGSVPSATGSPIVTGAASDSGIVSKVASLTIACITAALLI